MTKGDQARRLAWRFKLLQEATTALEDDSTVTATYKTR
jgi:hypothetical protein